jgi:hypothetical protein
MAVDFPLSGYLRTWSTAARRPPDRHDIRLCRLWCEGLRLVHAGVVSDHDLAVPIGYLGYGAQVRAHRAAQVVKDPMWYRAGQLVDALLRLECKSVLRLKDNPYVDACVHLLRRAIPGQLCQARQ